MRMLSSENNDSKDGRTRAGRLRVILLRIALILGLVLVALVVAVVLFFRPIVIWLSSDWSHDSTVTWMYKTMPFWIMRPVAEDCLFNEHEMIVKVITFRALTHVSDEDFNELEDSVLRCMRSPNEDVRGAAVVTVLEHHAATSRQVKASERMFNDPNEDEANRYFAGLVVLKAAADSGDAVREKAIFEQLYRLYHPGAEPNKSSENP
jgi:hypothetical protein